VKVVVVRATAKGLAKRQADMPFRLIADPERALYRRLGVGRRLRSPLSPRAQRAAIAGLAAERAARRGVLGPVKPTGGRFGLPADFLIAPHGRTTAQIRTARLGPVDSRRTSRPRPSGQSRQRLSPFGARSTEQEALQGWAANSRRR
jgi:hypothetical protein